MRNHSRRPSAAPGTRCRSTQLPQDAASHADYLLQRPTPHLRVLQSRP